MNETKTTVAELIAQYLQNEEKFEKGNDAAGKRARANLLELRKAVIPRRKDIQEIRNQRAAEKQK